MTENRKIIHIDADCFFAAIEIRDKPELKGRPVAIGGESDRRGVISTCNYEARRFGVRSAMATAYAKRLCPGLILLPSNMEKYQLASSQMHVVFHQFTDLIEPLSLDEAYLDVTASSESGEWIAEQIRQEIFAAVDITVSAGVASNKFLAKVASDWQKPDGLTVITDDQLVDFVADLSVKRIPGVGKVMQQKLLQLGISRCGELQGYSRDELQKLCGRFGLHLFDLCRGRDNRSVQPRSERKSLSVEETFSRDLSKLTDCLLQLDLLFRKLLQRLIKARGKMVEKIFVKLKFNDFTTTTVERQAASPELEDYCELLETAMSRSELPIRLIGVGVRFQGAPKDETVTQLTLFG